MRPLHPGATIAVVAPGSAPKSAARLAAGIAHLEHLGYRIIRADAGPRRGYLAAPDAARLDAFNAMLCRNDVDALFCVRGGYGALRILDRLDYEAARKHPKLLVGYSDVTALHLAFYKRAGWRGLSGPMVAVEWGRLDAASERLFWALAQGATPRPLLGPGGETLVPMRSGTAEGVLLGGNLSMIVRLLGTPYLPSLDGALLFIEEIGEMPYRLDALLAQLRLAGVFEQIGGLIAGGITEWEPPDDRPTLSVQEVLADYFADAAFPVATGLVYGHFPTKSTLPVGVRARLDVGTERAELSILESVV